MKPLRIRHEPPMWGKPCHDSYGDRLWRRRRQLRMLRSIEAMLGTEMEREPNWDDGGPTPWDVDDKFRAWIHALDEDVIQGEYGYEPGEFTIFAEHWHEHYRQGLTPQQSFKRALDAFAEDRRQREQERKDNWSRIQAADAAAMAKFNGSN